jgi:hypothetical protein
MFGEQNPKLKTALLCSVRTMKSLERISRSTLWRPIRYSSIIFFLYPRSSLQVEIATEAEGNSFFLKRGWEDVIGLYVKRKKMRKQ